MTARYLVGDVFDRLAELPDASVDLVLTSPPFLALRSYLPADHPDKAREIGSEPDPASFVDTLLALSAEWRRVLAPHGSIAVELGDTYASHDPSPSTKRNPAYKDSPKRSTETIGYRRNLGAGWPLAKSLALIPEAYRLALAYGINPHTGATSPAGRWRVRNVVRWVRPNPPVGALGDKFRPATSEMVIACTSKNRWFDLDAVRTPHVNATPQDTNGAKNAARGDGDGLGFTERTVHPGGSPPLDWWNIPTEPYAGSHYATWPRRLCVTPIEAMCPREVCRECGEPRRRIVGDTEYRPSGTHKNGALDMRDNDRVAPGVNQWKAADGGNTSVVATRDTLGWTDCGHDNYRPGLVLDPFAGSGTTLAVATGHGRDAIGIDLDERNADLALDRVGPMLLEVDFGRVCDLEELQGGKR